MPGLIDAELPSTGERDVSEPTPGLALDRSAADPALSHFLDKGFDIIA